MAPLLILDLQMPLWRETLFSSQFTASHMRKEVKPVWCWVPTTKGCGIRFELPEHQSPELQITCFSEPAAPLGVPAPVSAPPAPEKTLTAAEPNTRIPGVQVPEYTPISPALLCWGEPFASENTPALKPLPWEALKLHGTGAVITNLNLQSKLLGKASNRTRSNMIKQFWEQDAHTHRFLMPQRQLPGDPTLGCWNTAGMSRVTNLRKSSPVQSENLLPAARRRLLNKLHSIHTEHTSKVKHSLSWRAFSLQTDGGRGWTPQYLSER